MADQYCFVCDQPVDGAVCPRCGRDAYTTQPEVQDPLGRRLRTWWATPQAKRLTTWLAIAAAVILLLIVALWPSQFTVG